jgi:nucleoside-diphosphate-sugar epimerase
LQPLIARGYEVIATHSDRNPLPLQGVTWIKTDLLDQTAINSVVEQARATQLLHMAWYVEPGKMIASPDNLKWVVSSLELIRRFREAGGERCVVSGSCYEYDWRYGYLSADLTPRTPDTFYGCAKNGLYEAFRGYCAASGLAGAWGRIFFLYGPWENPRRLVSSVILSLLQDKEALSSHGEQIRDYMHVQDVADGLVTLLDSQAIGAYDIASGKATTLRSIVECIGKLTERSHLLRIGALPARANDLPLVVGNPDKFRRDLNWQPKFDIEIGLAATIQWWRAHSAQEGKQ